MEEEKKELVEETEEQEEKEEQAKEEKAEEKEEKKEEKKDFFDTKDETADFDKKDIEDNTAMGILAYIGILVLIPMLAAKDSKFARYHTNQGFTLFLFGFCTAVILGILGIIPYVGIVFRILGALVGLCFFVFMILGIVNVVQGKAKELPLIGKYRFLKEPDAKAEKEEKEETEEDK